MIPQEVRDLDARCLEPRYQEVRYEENKEVDTEEKANTDALEYSLTEIPLSALERVGKVFREGHEKYGRGNWRKGIEDKIYQLERLNHAIRHLLIYAHWLEHGEYIGEYKEGVKEDDLAKVMWFTVTQCEIERVEDEIRGKRYE